MVRGFGQKQKRQARTTVGPHTLPEAHLSPVDAFWLRERYGTDEFDHYRARKCADSALSPFLNMPGSAVGPKEMQWHHGWNLDPRRLTPEFFLTFASAERTMKLV
jgi:hypothetical protein